MHYHDNLMVGIYISSSILIIFVNLFIIGLVFFSKTLRKIPKNILMFSIAIADLLMGCFVLPLYIKMKLEHVYHSCLTHVILKVMAEHGIMFVTGWSLVTFNILHIKNNINLRLSCSRCFLLMSSCTKGVLLALLPWVAALCILVPLIVTNISFPYGKDHDDIACPFYMEIRVQRIANVVSLFSPFCVCVAALVFIVIFNCKSCQGRTEPTGLLLMEDNETLSNNAVPDLYHITTENPLMAAVPNIVYLLCHTPLILLIETDVGTRSHVFFIVADFFLIARSYLLPLSWFVFRNMNTEVFAYWSSLKKALGTCNGDSTIHFSAMSPISSTHHTQEI